VIKIHSSRGRCDAPFRAINLAVPTRGPDRDTCPLMAGTVTGWRSLPSQPPTAASIGRGYVHGFPKARLPFRHLSARYLRLASQVHMYVRVYVCVYVRTCVAMCVHAGKRPDSLLAARSQRRERTLRGIAQRNQIRLKVQSR